MTANHSLYFAELLASRLCHDLIAPIGAINTGLELFRETTTNNLAESDEILNLILHSAQIATARVSFFRTAFGHNYETLSLEETKRLLENYFLRGNLAFCWKIPHSAEATFKGWGRLLLNSLLWMGECAPRGGTLTIAMSHSPTPVLSLRLTADLIILHQGTLEAIEGRTPVEDLSPRTVACYLIHLIAKEKNSKISVQHTPAASELLLEFTDVLQNT
jgi:histidine phosphotransferase ChpT